MQELAARIGKSVNTVSRWECGKSSPKGEHIDDVARVLTFPREFFFGDAPPAMDGAVFRSLARTTARQRDTALAAAAQAVELDGWIEKHFERPAPNVPDLSGQKTPSDAAATLRAAWGLGYRPIPNLVHLLEVKGIRVYSLVHEGTEIDALSEWHGSSPFVFLNTVKSAERSRMDAAHELAHLALHAHSGDERKKVHEDEARAFAAAFLMPEPSFIASAPRHINLNAILGAKQEWGVSALAYVYRLNALRAAPRLAVSLSVHSDQISIRHGRAAAGARQGNIAGPRQGADAAKVRRIGHAT